MKNGAYKDAFQNRNTSPVIVDENCDREDFTNYCAGNQGTTPGFWEAMDNPFDPSVHLSPYMFFENPDCETIIIRSRYGNANIVENTNTNFCIKNDYKRHWARKKDTFLRQRAETQKKKQRAETQKKKQRIGFVARRNDRLNVAVEKWELNEILKVQPKTMAA